MSIPDIELANGVKIPQVGLGVFQISDENEVINSVKWAIEAGYRHIDTASFYDNEEAVGEGIIASGIDRSKLFITTKIWNDIRTYDDTMAQFQRSLDKLKLDPNGLLFWKHLYASYNSKIKKNNFACPISCSSRSIKLKPAL